MTETLPALPANYPIPVTGQIVDLNDAPTVLQALRDVRQAQTALTDARRVLEDALVAESQRQGTKTLRFGGLEGTVVGGDKVEWDVEELWKLREAGLPEDRLSQLVRADVTYKVDAAVARQLEAANPAYAAVIERARRRVPAPLYVRVKAS